MKPILFNSEMVQAILEGRKTVTRRAVKPQPKGQPVPMGKNSCWPGYFAVQGTENVICPPYQRTDNLWVRETWTTIPDGSYFYKASVECPDAWKGTWRPSIHMPKEAARIFLQVKEVRAERLQDIRHDPPGPKNQVVREGLHYLSDFIAEWEQTIKPADRPIYGWDANPWVWVISFEWLNRPTGEEKEKT